MAVASPVFARGRFPKLRLVDVVAKAPAMDGRQMRALATVGASVDGLPEGSGRAPAFAAHLLDVIARHELEAFFHTRARPGREWPRCAPAWNRLAR
jgi:hypothetical protein